MKEREYIERPVQVSLVQPAIRTVVVMAYTGGDPDEAEYDVYPVLAIEVSINQRWCARSGYPNQYVEESAMNDAGWRLVDISARRTLIVADGTDIGFTDLEDLGWPSAAMRVVPCSWPPSQDAKRLAEFIELAKRDAVQIHGTRESTRKAQAEKGTADAKPAD